MSLDAIAKSGDPLALFWRCCKNLGLRRAKDGRDAWTAEEWTAWAKRGRAAFGPDPRALFGQLALVETMLEHGLDGPTIAAELRRIDGNRAAEQQRKAVRQAEDVRRATKQIEEAEIEAEVRKTMVRAEAKRRADARMDELGIARPGVQPRKKLIEVNHD
jgi:hypothetical protein